jgi:hypothetical protein
MAGVIKAAQYRRRRQHVTAHVGARLASVLAHALARRMLNAEA